MKKLIMIVSIVLIAALLAVGASFFLQKFKKPLTPSDVLASGAVFYWDAVDMDQALRDFLATNFVKQVRSIDFEAAMKEIGAKEQEIALYHQLAGKIANKSNFEAISKLFGNELAVAFYPGRMLKGASQMDKMMEMVSNIAFVTKLSPEVHFIEVFTAAVSQLNPNITESTQDYNGKTIHTIDVQGLFFKIVYVRIKDLLVFGVGDSAAKHAIDALGHPEKSLAHDPIFLSSMEQRVDGADQSGFFNYGMFMQKMKDALLSFSTESAGADRNVQQQLKNTFEGADGFKVFSFSMKYGTIMKSRFDMSFDRAALSERIKKFYNFSPKNNTSLSFVPKSAIFYSWSAIVGLDFYWDKLKEEMQKASAQKNAESMGGGAMAGIAQGKIFGMNGDGIISLLTDEFGWYLLGVDVGKIPMPKGVFFLGVSNMDQVKALIQKSIAQIGFLRFETETYKDVEIRFLSSFPLLPNLEPAYCVFQDYLLISTNRETLKRSIDVASGAGESLKDAQIFKNSDYAFAQEGNAVLFFKIASLAKQGQKILKWANKWADVQDERRKAFKAGVEQRLEDVKKDLKTKQDELTQLESQLVDSQKQEDEVTVSPETMDAMTKEFEQKKKLLETSQEALKKLKDEEAQLMNAQNDEGELLTETGAKRLAQLQAQLPKRQDRVDELTAEFNDLTAKKQAMEESVKRQQALSMSIKEREDHFKKIRGEMKASEETQKQLEASLQAYETADLPTPEQRKMVLEKIINPFLDALGNIPWAGVKTKMMEDRIRSEFFMEMH